MSLQIANRKKSFSFINKAFLTVMTVFLSLFFINEVNAGYGVEGDYGGGAVNLDEDSATHKTSWPRPYVAGIRISFVNSNGTQLKTIDYIVDEDYEAMLNTRSSIYYNAGLPSRLKYNGSSATFKKMGRVSSFAYKLSELQNKIDKQNYFDINLVESVNKRDFDDIFDDLARSNHLDSNYEEKVKEFFKFINFDSSFLDPYFNDNSSELFITFEPTTVVKINNKYYYGTNYELYTFAVNQPASGDWGSSTSAAGDLASILRKLMPCTTYLDGSLADKIKSVLGTSNPSLLNKFTSSSYFNGKLKIYPDNEKATYVCDTTAKDKKSRFDSSDIPAYALSIGVLWLGEYIEESDCDAINAANPNLVSNLASIFDNGGSISDLKTEVLKYKNPSTNKTLDADWYIHECTCYGIYDAYEDYIDAYESSNQTKANNTVITKRNWFNVPSLFDTKGWIIKKDFEDGISAFVDYNNQIKNINNVTEWDYSKYVKLNCPTQENYWCSEFEEWYNKNKPSGYSNISTIKNYFNRYSWTSSRLTKYKRYLTNMIEAYNLAFYPATGFYWSLDTTSNTSNTKLGITTFSYKDYCLGEGTTTTSYNCTPDYDIGSCEDDGSIEYKDSSEGSIDDEYWNNCVFNDNGVYYNMNTHKTSNSSTGELSYKDNNLGSDYCEVYCIETLDANFPSGGITVEAGRYFTWSSGSITGSRTCKTKSIEYETFESDLDAANDAIVDAYVAWQLEKAKKTAIANKTTEPNSSNCSCINNKGGISCCEKTTRCSRTCSGSGSCPSGCKGCSTTTDDNGNVTYSGTEYYTCCDTYNYTRYDEHSASASVSINYDNTSVGGIWSLSWCSNKTDPSANISSTKNAYDAAIKERNAIIADMKSCYNFDEDNVYKVEPIVYFDYSDGTYNAAGEFETTTRYDEVTDEDDCVEEEETKVSCSGEKCTSSPIKMQRCTYKEYKRTARTNFTLPDDIYVYINKDETISDNNIINSNRYTKMEFSSFPVAFATEDGWYGINHNRGKLNATYSNLGHISNSGNSYTDLDLILEELGDYGVWECDYKVTSKLITDGGVELVYRTIDLTDPFPDIDGSNRDTGSNWCDIEGDCSYNNDLVKSVIINNRDVTSNEVYNIEPMYSFTLTPSDIYEIRRYNKQNQYSSYIGSLGSETYNYKCSTKTGSEGKACISDYLTKLISIGEATGTCVDSKYRSFNDVGNFEGCRY